MSKIERLPTASQLRILSVGDRHAVSDDHRHSSSDIAGITAVTCANECITQATIEYSVHGAMLDVSIHRCGAWMGLELQKPFNYLKCSRSRSSLNPA